MPSPSRPQEPPHACTMHVNDIGNSPNQLPLGPITYTQHGQANTAGKAAHTSTPPSGSLLDLHILTPKAVSHAPERRVLKSSTSQADLLTAQP